MTLPGSAKVLTQQWRLGERVFLILAAVFIIALFSATSTSNQTSRPVLRVGIE